MSSEAYNVVCRILSISEDAWSSLSAEVMHDVSGVVYYVDKTLKNLLSENAVKPILSNETQTWCEYLLAYLSRLQDTYTLRSVDFYKEMIGRLNVYFESIVTENSTFFVTVDTDDVTGMKIMLYDLFENRLDSEDISFSPFIPQNGYILPSLDHLFSHAWTQESKDRKEYYKSQLLNTALFYSKQSQPSNACTLASKKTAFHSFSTISPYLPLICATAVMVYQLRNLKRVVVNENEEAALCAKMLALVDKPWNIKSIADNPSNDEGLDYVGVSVDKEGNVLGIDHKQVTILPLKGGKKEEEQSTLDKHQSRQVLKLVNSSIPLKYQNNHTHNSNTTHEYTPVQPVQDTHQPSELVLALSAERVDVWQCVTSGLALLNGDAKIAHYNQKNNITTTTTTSSNTSIHSCTSDSINTHLQEYIMKNEEDKIIENIALPKIVAISSKFSTYYDTNVYTDQCNGDVVPRNTEQLNKYQNSGKTLKFPNVAISGPTNSIGIWRLLSDPNTMRYCFLPSPIAKVLGDEVAAFATTLMEFRQNIITNEFGSKMAIDSKQGRIAQTAFKMYQNCETNVPPPGKLASMIEENLSWNVLWTWRHNHIRSENLLFSQKMNHFARSYNLTRKDFLKRNIIRYAKAITHQPHITCFDIVPQTYILPLEEEQFKQRFYERQAQFQSQFDAYSRDQPAGAPVPVGKFTKEPLNVFNMWIAKPSNSSRGRGIYLSNDCEAIIADAASSKKSKDLGMKRSNSGHNTDSYSDHNDDGELDEQEENTGINNATDEKTTKVLSSMVVQEYIANPLLQKGHKFDFRLYVLVTSFEPLEAYIYNEGYARYAMQPYSNAPKDMNNLFIHLTNSSVGTTFDETGDEATDEPTVASDMDNPKQLFSECLRDLRRNGIDTVKLCRSIDETIITSLLCVKNRIGNQPHCFELFGYDIMIDDQLKSWLIETNSSPSMNLITDIDKIVKPRLIADTLNLVAPLPINRAYLGRLQKLKLNTGVWPLPPHYVSVCRSLGKSWTREYTPSTRIDSSIVKFLELNQDILCRMSAEKVKMAMHLHYLYGGKRPRFYGELPVNMGNFRRMVPNGPDSPWGALKQVRMLVNRIRYPRKNDEPQIPAKENYTNNAKRNTLPGII